MEWTRDAHCAQVCAKCLPCPLEGWALARERFLTGFAFTALVTALAGIVIFMVFVVAKEVRESKQRRSQEKRAIRSESAFGSKD
jgi:heme/copper-type cytochrome/quinol oxidase subunit 2